jgi:hypothetical protein
VTPLEVLTSLHRRGITVASSGDGRLRYRPSDALSATERAELGHHREALLGLLEDPVGWRVAVMAEQMPTSGPIPLLIARPGVHFPLSGCCSCGEPLGPAQRYRCAPCVEAAVTVLGRTG